MENKEDNLKDNNDKNVNDDNLNNNSDFNSEPNKEDISNMKPDTEMMGMYPTFGVLEAIPKKDTCLVKI